jgi:hypothetical protein
VHTAQPGEPALVAVPGYDYAHVRAGGRSANELLHSDPGHLKAASARVVLHQWTMIAALALVQVKPRYVHMPGLRQAMTSVFVHELAGPGAQVTKETIHAGQVTIARQGCTVTYCWFHAGVVTVVTGDNGHDIHDYAEAHLQSARA